MLVKQANLKHEDILVYMFGMFQIYIQSRTAEAKFSYAFLIE